eukprot:snap_masked-scaffold_75-processed-gene-0.48-mRNA-1 protein AED:1.00 eAED:1.00 QI:0/0/0/0/1/1/2/0/104
MKSLTSSVFVSYCICVCSVYYTELQCYITVLFQQLRNLRRVLLHVGLSHPDFSLAKFQISQNINPNSEVRKSIREKGSNFTEARVKPREKGRKDESCHQLSQDY